MRRLKRFILLVAATVSLVLTPVAANAYTLLECDGSGKVVTGTSLFDADPASDPASHSGECQYSDQPVVEHVFSLVICDFVVILNQIMDGMYCGMHYYLVNIVAALLTLYVTIYGAQILMGTAQLATRDALVRLLKLSFVYVFATESAFGISYIFRFFMGFIADASTAVLNTLSSNVAAQSDGVCDFKGLDASNVMSMYNFLDYLVCHALIGPASTANSKVQGFFLAMIFALPPMTLLFLWWLRTTVMALVTTLVAFLKCLAVISFLVTLSPIFIGFFLFHSTAHIFENWLRYLIAFSVQIVIVLAIVVFWIMTINQYVIFFNQMSDLIFPYVPLQTVGSVYAPAHGWGICPPYYSTDPATGAPTAVCDYDQYGDIFDANPPVCDATTCQPPANPNWADDNEMLIPPEKIVDQGEFLYFVFYHIFTLLLICYCFNILLQKSDDIARSLAGPVSAPSLLPGFGAGSIGNANSFEAPAGGATKAVAQDFHRMLGRD